jgi:Tol biopolymer transport system component
MRSTVAGVIMGTAAYMSPEQAKGKPVDRRADIWAFGVVLAEMLTGRRLYQYETISETLAAVLLNEPDLSRLPGSTPGAVRTLIRRCLDRDALRRLRDIGEARVVLEQPEFPAVEAPPARRYTAWGWVAAGLLALALAVALYVRPTEDPRRLSLALVPPEGTALNGFSGIPAVSPDGHRVAFVGTTAGRNNLWVRELDSTAARSLPGTDGASYPFWSPDSHSLGFFAEGKLKKIETTGGLAVSLCDSPASAGGSWSSTGVIIFTRPYNGGIMRIPEEGGNPQPVAKGDGNNGFAQRFPWFLPDGRQFLYLRLYDEPEKSGIYVSSLDSNESRFLLPALSNAEYAVPGYLLYVRERSLMAQPFDAGPARITGRALTLVEDIDYQAENRRGEFSASGNGVLVYTSGSKVGLTQLTWFDRDGKQVGTVGTPAGMQWPAISPDGKSVVVDQLEPNSGAQNLWLHDLVRGTQTRLTFNSRLNRYVVWSPDGGHIAFVSNRDGFFRIYRKAISGAEPEQIVHSTPAAWPDDWSHDGQRLIVEVPPGGSNETNDLWVVPLSGDRKPQPLLNSKARERWGRLAPDGRWLAYASDESSRSEIYVTTFPNPGGKWQVSIGGGSMPVWRHDGKELFFLSPERKLMAVAVKGGDRFEAGAPTPLFETNIAVGPNVRFDVGPNGRFLIPVQPQQTGNTTMTVRINWNAGLK